MKRLYVYFSILLLSAALMTGCKSDNPLDPGNNNPDPPSSPLPTIPGVNAINVIGIIRVSTPVGNGLPGSIDANVGVATFGSPGQDVGTVTAMFNSNNYEFVKSTNNGSVSYNLTPTTQNPQGIPLNSGNSNVSFSVSNYSLTASTVIVPGQISITAPSSNANVPRNANLAVSWSVSDAGEWYGIFITDKDGHSVIKTANSNVTTYSFTAAELSTLTAGTAYVYTMTFNYTLSNNNETVIIGESVAVNQVTLQ